MIFILRLKCFDVVSVKKILTHLYNEFNSNEKVLYNPHNLEKSLDKLTANTIVFSSFQSFYLQANRKGDRILNNDEMHINPSYCVSLLALNPFFTVKKEK